MKTWRGWMTYALAALLVCSGAWAQEEEPKKPEQKAKPTPEDVLKDGKRYEGFLPLYKTEDSLFADIPTSALGKPFMMSVSLAGGVAQGYLVSGMTRDEAIYYWKLTDNRLFLVKKNVRHMAKAGTPIALAVAEDFTDSNVAVLQVRAKSDKSVVVNLGELLFTDYVMVGKDLRSTLGVDYSLDTKRTTWGSIKTFPENVEIEVEATYSGRDERDVRTVVDSRAVTIRTHYSFSSILASDFKPRAADDRIGYFLTARMDYSLPGIDTPFERYVNRWKLDKADPSAEISPPKKPIVFYIERSVPYEFRPIVREAVLEWNKAFAKAGIIDAIEVRFQEENADWDAEDVRYNTIRWMTGEARYAIGPSRTNPLTGEIYDADILVDSNWLRTFQKYYDFYVDAASALDSGAEGMDALLDAMDRRPAPEDEESAMYRCEYAAGLGEQMALAALAAGVEGEATEDKGVPREFIREGLKELIMHEVGHTLGLRHNFKSSSAIAFEDLHNKAKTSKTGLVGSVMDYSLINLAPAGTDQGFYFTPTLGAWDYLAIEYGYKTFSGKNGEDEKKALAAIAARAAQPALVYGTDEDLGADIDPLTNQRDMSGDLIAFAKQRTEIMTGLRDKLIDKLIEDGEGYQQARTAFLYTLSDMQRAQYYAARYVGGFYVNRNHKGDKGERPVLEVVPAALQRDALGYCAGSVLSDDAYAFEPAMLAKMAPDLWNHWGAERPSRLDLALHDMVLSGQMRVIGRLFSSSVLTRVEDGALYVPEGEVPLTIADIYEVVTNAVWSELKKDITAEKWNAASPFISSYRRNLQRAFLKSVLLDHMLDPSGSLPRDARAVAFAQVRMLEADLSALLASVSQNPDVTLDALSGAHLRESRERVRKALEAAYSVNNY